ncbi:carbohydrate binding family 9 domain-containing protein [Aliikangiella sp. G2MR2-5]|uniref:carbohydrate binding family 9 domain-containing protein n=1 Tax=Aliikangiella sp. G2MR2-5 TaxID=2788943 RepID=UPI0018A942C0|nr:carbohydrate binding family 9 domain-containing protein [Aliikangiella sp. G2MR2-5]
MKITALTTILGLATTLAGGIGTAIASPKQTYKLPHIAPESGKTIKIDGSINESSWENALKVELNFETSPGENVTPPVRTLVYLMEDGQNLYVAFNAEDPEPEKIRNYLSDRDSIWESDFVGVKFDTFGESKKAFQFFVNAAGVQADATQEDFVGDDSSWDAIWDSAGQVNDSGYQVEMAIPFRALRFPETNDAQSWPMELLRFYPREHRHRIANTPVDRDIACQICQFDQLVGMKNIKPSKNLVLAPTLVALRADSREPFANWKSGDVESEASLDIRWGITQDTVLNATINPDFSQVEADAAQIDVNNPFTLFLSEKRPFFLDGADYFNSMENLVYTRNIIQPDFGAKVSGQIDGHSFGFISVDDQFTNIILPGRLSSDIAQIRNSADSPKVDSHNLIARYSYDLGNKNYLGFVNTDRRADGYSNQVNAFDGKYWFDQYHSINAQYISTDTENPRQLIEDFNLAEQQSGDALVVRFRHDSRNWWGYINYMEYDKDFRADLGFISQVGYDKKILGLHHRWYPSEKDSWWTQIEFGGDWDETFDYNGKMLEQETEGRLSISGKHQSQFVAGFVVRDKLWEPEIATEEGILFDESFYFFGASLKPLSGLTLVLDHDRGDFIDYENGELGKRVGYYPSIDWQLNQHLNFRLDYQHVDFDNSSGNLFVAKVSNFRTTYQMNIRSYLRLTIQSFELDSNNPRKDKSSQLLYSYKLNPQTLFFAGYSDAGFRDEMSSRLFKTNRSVFMKFSYALQL